MRVEDDDADGNGDGRRRLTKNGAIDKHPAWSPDGTKIAFQSDRSGHHQIHVMKAKPEGKKNRPRNISKDPAGAYEPNWSPDGTKIAFTSGIGEDSEIYRMTKDGTDKARLTQNQVHDSAPSWSPDGAKIAFTGFRTHLAAIDPTYQILAMDSADGHPESQLTFGNPLLEGNWGPDWALRLE